MKKILLFIAVCGLSNFAFSQQSIPPSDASKHIGETVKVCGKIYGGRYFETSNNAPTLLNMGAAYPASPLTIMIPGAVRVKMGYAPEIELKEKNVCVTGKVELFKEKPEIVVNDLDQLEISK